MQVARRIYFYLVAFISLQMLLAGARNLLRLLAELALGLSRPVLNQEQYARDQFSLWGAILVVGALVWAIHWALIRRAVARDDTGGEERRTIWRALFLYATLLVAAWQIFFAVGALVREVLASLAMPGTSQSLLTFADSLPALLVYGAAWLAHWAVRRADLSHVPEYGASATVARWYIYLVSYGALSALLWAVSTTARDLWRTVTTPGAADLLAGYGATQPLANAAGFAVAGLLVWFGHWSLARRRLAVDEAERRSTLRKVYLYATIGQTVGVTLTNLALFAYTGLRTLIGTDPLAASGDTLLTAAGQPLLTALVYGTFWAYHRRVLDHDAALVATEGMRQATIRRIYTYLVSVIGLALLVGGVADLLRLLLDLVLGGRATTALGNRGWGDEISRFVTLIVVGVLVWSAHWLTAQRRANAADGVAERHALTRRIYLFLTLFVGVITLLSGGAVLIYRLLRSLGIGLTGADRSDISWAIAAIITAGVLFAYHLRILLADQRRHPEEQGAGVATTPPTVPATTRLILLSAPTPARLDAVLADLPGKLPEDTTLTVFAANEVNAAEIRAWIAGQHGPSPATAAVERAPGATPAHTAA